MKTTIYLIRHGESIGNFNKECLGHTDKDLTEFGFKQAESTAKALSWVSVCAVYSSDLIRAYNTAYPHANLRGLSVIASSSLRELYFGKWEGMKVEDIRREWGDMFEIGWRKNFGTFTAPLGESVQDCARRMYDAIIDIARGYPGGNIVIASHAAAIRALWGKINHLPPEDVCEAYPFPENASYSVIEYFDGDLVPVSYSNSAHLSELQ